MNAGQEFPKMLYHRTLAPVIVENAEEQDALGAEWHEGPFGFHTPFPPQPRPARRHRKKHPPQEK